jgi:hypothetical protein
MCLWRLLNVCAVGINSFNTHDFITTIRYAPCDIFVPRASFKDITKIRVSCHVERILRADTRKFGLVERNSQWFLEYINEGRAKIHLCRQADSDSWITHTRLQSDIASHVLTYVLSNKFTIRYKCISFVHHIYTSYENNLISLVVCKNL